MINFFKYKYLMHKIWKHTFIVFITLLIFFSGTLKSFSEENVFIIDDVEVEGVINTNFSRDKYIDKAFLNSFKILKSRILLSRDLNKMDNIKLQDIKKLITSFAIKDEKYNDINYKAIFKISYNDIKVKKLLGKKNISFSQPKNITVVFFPVLFIDDEIISLRENYFYQQWLSVKIKNETINFILPIEDLDDISQIKKMKNTIEKLNINNLINKYNVKNYVFALMNYENNKLNVYLKTNFNNNEFTKNLLYKLNDIKNESKMNIVLKDLKMQVTDLWKEVNIINLSIPLAIKIKFQYEDILEIGKLEDSLKKINIINNFSLDELNINNSLYKIYYFGNPKRLSNELLKFNYKLKNVKGHWELYFDD